MKKKPVLHKKEKNNLFIKGRHFKGGVDAGTVYGIILLSIVVGGGYLMLGDIAPKLASPDDQQSVNILKPWDKSKNSNLQLKTFNGVTGEPTPTDTPTPTPSPTTPPPAPADHGGGNGSGSGSGSCFVRGTKILMANKTQKNIEDVKAGDKVMGYDGKKEVSETVQQMESPIRDHHYDVRLANGTILGVTDEHPLYTKDGWKSIVPVHTANENPTLKVGKLVVGNQVLTSSGEYVEIISMTYKPGRIQVYNLKRVSGNNDFYANGVLSHNKNGSGSGSGSGGAPANNSAG